MKTLVLWVLVLLAGSAQGMALEEKARELERELISPCCWRQSVSDHTSQAAEEVRREIRTLLQRGMTRQEVLDFYVEQYGKIILSKPTYEGFDLLVYVLPGVFLIVLGVWLSHYLAQNRKPISAVQAAPVEGIYTAALKRELRDWDE